MINREKRKALISAEFKKRFNASPQIWSRAPGRVDLMGSHTDYNMGYVMTMTIDRDTWIAARPRSDRTVHLQSLNLDGKTEFLLDHIEFDTQNSWSNYVRGVAHVMENKGIHLCGFDGLIHSTVPFGSGLSSSAALEMAAVSLFASISHVKLDPVNMAIIGQKAENEFVGVNTGILDQYSSAMGKANSTILLDCRHLTSQTVPMSNQFSVVICDTRAKRKLIGSEYDMRRQQCEEAVRIFQQVDPSVNALRDVSMDLFKEHESLLPPIVAKRARFIIEESQRVCDLASALPTGDRKALSHLFNQSFDGACNLFEIGAPAMHHMMHAMQQAPGFIAGRQAGGGFGGCMTALVEVGKENEFAAAVEQSYFEASKTQPSVYPIVATEGAGMVDHDDTAV
ncbi:MAG: galactokinase [Chloroflexota bacterium]